jgi:cysteine desulfurase/selenocysteine lyase
LNPTTTQSAFDVETIRAQFPALDQTVHGKPLVYLDNAATSQKPQVVIDAIDDYYRRYNSNVHRGLHALSEKATAEFEGAREKVRRFIGAESVESVIFTRGTTESINLVAQSWGRTNLAVGDEVLITHMEHHSNIVPWQLICEQTGATLKVVPITDAGELDMDAFASLLSEKTKMVAVVAVSNSLGTVNPVAQIVAAAKQVGAATLIDGAQSVQHGEVDVTSLGCDFYCFSGHKVFGPTGIGVLYGRRELLDAMPPYQGGGDMIQSVTFEKTEWNVLPYKFEAGTPHVEGGIGLGVALDWLDGLDRQAVTAYEHELTDYGMQRLGEIDGLRLIGTAANKIAAMSFVLDGIHAYDIGPVLDRMGVAVRTGHHCTQPVMDRFGVQATVRASVALYNTRDEIDALVQSLVKAKTFFE